MEIQPLFVLSLLVYCVACERHSLRYFVTTTSVPIPGLPMFSIVGSIDDMPLGRYSSETGQAQPFYKWMEKKIKPEHWKEMNKIAQYFESYHKNFIGLLKALFNQTTENNILQVKLECELHNDGTINGGEEFGYNGKEIIVFDKKRLFFIPLTQEAQIITQRWNVNPGSAERHKALIEHHCIKWMKTYFSHGNNTLERKVPPKVKISDRQLDNAAKLHCHVYGFYPQTVVVKWVKNGVNEVYSEEVKQILPNPDGTYQVSVTVEVIPKDGDNYTCHVTDSSLDNTMIILWGECLL
ncbi:major histocompatibility complex class I-related gene protein-like [Bombina bombina]|uniref:major histocompatibility complex class I-related gene protein-like n=1 Tax=Bombina bombina TaxID=8345 RepID=UPI00235AB9FE|nr:major histocompatibility complex class I-related gene protein-like [Bombina bombina]